MSGLLVYGSAALAGLYMYDEETQWMQVYMYVFGGWATYAIITGENYWVHFGGVLLAGIVAMLDSKEVAFVSSLISAGAGIVSLATMLCQK